MIAQREGTVVENVRSVSIGKIVVSDTPSDVLVAYGLSSCVAVCLYDPIIRAGGMLHALLPADSSENGGNPAKFVDQGTSLLIESLLKLGAKRTRLIAQLCGGAQTLSAPGFEGDSLNIGERNVQAAKHALRVARLGIRAEATGGRMGRTVRFYIASGQVTVKSLGQDVQALVLSADTKTMGPKHETCLHSGQQEVCHA